MTSPGADNRLATSTASFSVSARDAVCPAALNAANEVAVQAFLDRRLRFTDIVTVAREVMDKHPFVEHPSLEEIIQTDNDARLAADELILEKAI